MRGNTAVPDRSRAAALFPLTVDARRVRVQSRGQRQALPRYNGATQKRVYTKYAALPNFLSNSSVRHADRGIRYYLRGMNFAGFLCNLDYHFFFITPTITTTTTTTSAIAITKRSPIYHIFPNNIFSPLLWILNPIDGIFNPHLLAQINNILFQQNLGIILCSPQQSLIILNFLSHIILCCSICF